MPSDDVLDRGPDERGDREEPLLQAGDRVRREVLGDTHVDRSRANATDFTRPLQDLGTEYCWGAIWSARAWAGPPAARSTSPC